MSRWHADWCTSPIIQVGDDQIPRCEKCLTSAHARLKRTNRSDPVLVAPKDEEYGSLNLSWPPTVTFTSGENVIHPPADKSKNDQDAQPAPCHSFDSAVVGHGAVTALSSDEFRLAVLHAVGDKGKSYPIHVDLEPYKDTHFSDYDAVSYTWGDDNGNSERCHPIYVGHHWDIVFQTKNCCDVLRYLRPSRGLKLIWIDAICIDQNNAEERATQVAKMGQIYSRCSQVWAWMGDDLVSNDLQGLPERRWLHELGTTSSYVGTFSQSRSIRDIWKLLQRRYFRRVWVIQELVLAPRVLIPIGNVIFAADHTTARKLTQSENDSENKSKVSWKKTEAPWFEHVAQGHIGGLGLWDMMALTSKSHASDFRDKLYGILGLLSFESDNNLLQPNYAISARQMVIGFVAHCIINEGKPQLLLAAQGYSAQKNPSWLPAWETQTSWEQSFVELPDLAYNDEKERLSILVLTRL
ncbi:heterokaryon incompatibility protein-domain-containing protein [Colletotrichum lupini]|nr:heterokaryon incompatibility protein-domain-containing protein [Colletotrichum lupini]